ncbi:sensor histidine kinase [Pikeienuella sp. HZG-20]|uniref:sensor histidine kinase n=1 Tax=Paludibacillus litoralis TaxID=3133267 RepID=UPI0030EB4CC6
MDTIKDPRFPVDAPAAIEGCDGRRPAPPSGDDPGPKQETRGRRLRRALAAADVGFWEYRRSADGVWLDARASDLVGLSSFDQTVPLGALMRAIHPDDVPMFRAGVEGDDALRITYRTNGNRAAPRWLRSFGDWSRPRGGDSLTGVTLDVTEEMAHRREADLLLQEMRHRTGNLFSILGGLTALNAASATSAADLARTLRGRLASLARSHALSIGGDPSHDIGELRALVETLIAPFSHGGAQFLLDGPDAPLSEDARTSLSLVIYEWATNAVKYGALSTTNGRVAIRWRWKDDMLRLTWSETGGPPVATPTKFGFGNQLQTLALARIGGAAMADWRPSGVVITLRAKAGLTRP